MIRSSHALIISLALIIANGYVKALFVPALPYETMVTGIVAICVGYITKRIVQKMDMFNGKKDI